jgi:hypothetical protein
MTAMPTSNDADARSVTIRVSPAPANAPPVIVRLPDGTNYPVTIDGDFRRLVPQIVAKTEFRKMVSGRRRR